MFGTVVDWRSGIAAAVRSFADRHDLELDPAHSPIPAAVAGQVAGIATIKQGGYIVGPLSNGNTSLLLDMAKAAGLATAFIARPLEHGPGAPEPRAAAADWDLTGASITDIAARLQRG